MLGSLLKEEPLGITLLRFFILSFFPCTLLLGILERNAPAAFATNLELFGFAWFLLFVPLLPVYFLFEIGGLIAVLIKPSWSNVLGKAKWHLYSLLFATITYVAWYTNLLMIW